MSGAEGFTAGEIRRALESIDKRLEGLDKKLEAKDSKIHERINKVEDCINQDVKPKLMQVIADSDWYKRGFWYLAGMGSSALLLVIGVIVSMVIGGR